jgi:hypothetical protein
VAATRLDPIRSAVDSIYQIQLGETKQARRPDSQDAVKRLTDSWVVIRTPAAQRRSSQPDYMGWGRHPAGILKREHSSVAPSAADTPDKPPHRSIPIH